MAKENTTYYIILGLLTHENMTGYDIKKRIDYTISKFWDVGYGQIYPTLKVLEKDGFVTKATAEKSKGPEKVVFSITERGKGKFLEWLSVPEQKEYIKYEILLKLFFGSLLTTEVNMEKIKEFQKEKKENLKEIEGFKESLTGVLSKSEDHLYYYLTVLFGEHIYKAYIAWANEAEKLLKDRIL